MRLKKALLWIAIILVVLVLAVKLGEVYAEKHYSNRVIPIKDKVSIMIGGIDISLLNGGVVLKDVRLLDTLRPAAVGQIDKIAVQGIRLIRLIRGGGFSMRGLKVEGAACELYLNRLKTDSSAVVRVDSLGSIVTIDSLNTPGTNKPVDAVDTIDKMLYFSAPLVHVRFDNDMHPDLRALSIDNIRFRPGEGKYDINVASIFSSAGLQLIEIDSFQLIPRYPKYEFGFRAGRRMGSIDMLVEKIEVHHFDLKAMTRDSLLAIQSIVCKRGVVSVFSDKRVPIDTDRYGPLPHEALLNMSNRIAIDSVLVKDVDVRYTSVNPSTMEEGFLEFKRSYVTVTNITNDSIRIEGDSIMTIDLESKFTNEGELNAHFDFALNRKDYQFVWHGSLGRMKLGNLDSFVLPIASMNITEGNCHGLDFHIVSDYDTSRGTLAFQFTDLKVKVMDSEHAKERKFLSAVAGLFVLRSNNLEGNKKYVEGKIKFGREMYRGFPDYVWKSLENGILHTILPEGLAKTIEHQPEKAKEKEERKKERQSKKEQRRAKKNKK